MKITLYDAYLSTCISFNGRMTFSPFPSFCITIIWNTDCNNSRKQGKNTKHATPPKQKPDKKGWLKNWQWTFKYHHLLQQKIQKYLYSFIYVPASQLPALWISKGFILEMSIHNTPAGRAYFEMKKKTNKQRNPPKNKQPQKPTQIFLCK